jgi:biopolymer transport protein TolR
MAAGAINVASAGGRSRRGRRRPIMSDINVTPFVDVMLVLLIVFMVSAPLLTVGVPLNLPQSQAKSLQQNNQPLTVSVTSDGKVYLQKDEIALNDLIPKLKAIIDARGGQMDETIYVRGDKKIDYGTMANVLGRISAVYHKISIITDVEQGG